MRLNKLACLLLLDHNHTRLVEGVPFIISLIKLGCYMCTPLNCKEQTRDKHTSLLADYISDNTKSFVNNSAKNWNKKSAGN